MAKSDELTMYQLYKKLINIEDRDEFIKTLRENRKSEDESDWDRI